jgi:methionyl aminopeptidase
LVSKTLGLVAEEIKEGMSTLELDKMAEAFIRDHGGEPAFKGYPSGSDAPPFPGSLCISVNEEVVHGIPGRHIIQPGDIVSVDCGVKKNGFFGDHAYTFMIGEVDEKVAKLVRVTKECLYIGIEEVKKGNTIGDIGFAINKHARRNSFHVVRDLVGHGLGRNLHEGTTSTQYW